MRLDPYHLPHTVTFATSNMWKFSYKIDRNGAVMKRVLGWRLAGFYGATAKSVQGRGSTHDCSDENGSTIFTLELHHHDPDLCLPVLVADNLDDIAADWHSWSRIDAFADVID